MRPLAEAKALAAELIELLGDKCQRIEVAGSIRRLAPDVKDVELVAVPKTSPAQNDLFGEVSAERNHLLDELNLLVRLGLLSKRISDDGKACWGPRHQRALYKGFPVDVFQVLPPAQWGRILAIRTGPAEFSKRLVTKRSHGGLMPDDMLVAQGALWRQDGDEMAPVGTSEESYFFGALALNTPRPEERR